MTLFSYTRRVFTRCHCPIPVPLNSKESTSGCLIQRKPQTQPVPPHQLMTSNLKTAEVGWGRQLPKTKGAGRYLLSFLLLLILSSPSLPWSSNALIPISQSLAKGGKLPECWIYHQKRRSVRDSCDSFSITNFSFISKPTSNDTQDAPGISYWVEFLLRGFPVLHFDLSPIITLAAAHHTCSVCTVLSSHYDLRSACHRKTPPSVQPSRIKCPEQGGLSLIVPQIPLMLGSKGRTE